MYTDDRVCGFGPDEGLGITVSVVDVALDGGLKLDDGMEDAAPQALVGQLGKEAFDHVDPRCRGWREMRVEAGVALQPTLHLRMLVGLVVVGDQVKIEVGRGVAVDSRQEAPSCVRDAGRVAFCRTEGIGTPKVAFAAQWLVDVFPCQRFAPTL